MAPLPTSIVAQRALHKVPPRWRSGPARQRNRSAWAIVIEVGTQGERQQPAYYGLLARHPVHCPSHPEVARWPQ